MKVKVFNSNIFENRDSAFLLVAGHDGLNSHTSTKQKWEAENNISLKHWELVEIPGNNKLKYVRYVDDHISLELYLKLLWDVLKFCDSKGLGEVAIQPPRINEERPRIDTFKNKLINKRTITEMMLSFYHFINCYPNTKLKLIRLYSLSPLLKEEIGGGPIEITPFRERDEKSLLKAVANYVFFKDEIVKEKIMYKYHISDEKVIELLDKLSDLGIINRYDGGPRRVILEDFEDFRKTLKKI